MYKTIALVCLFLGFSWSGCTKGTSITKVVPDFGNVSGNDDVVIHGSGFKPGFIVEFGKKQVSSITIESDSRIHVKTPPGVEGKVDIVLIRDDGKSFVLENGFRYTRNAAPTK